MNRNDDEDTDKDVEPPLTPGDAYNRRQWEGIHRAVKISVIGGVLIASVLALIEIWLL